MLAANESDLALIDGHFGGMAQPTLRPSKTNGTEMVRGWYADGTRGMQVYLVLGTWYCTCYLILLRIDKTSSGNTKNTSDNKPL